MDDDYSFDANMFIVQNKVKLKCNDCTATENAILEYLIGNPTATQAEVAAAVGKSLRSIKADMAALQEKGLLDREGAKKNGRWIVKIPE